MSKILLKIRNLTKKLYLIIYQLTIAFTILFYAVLKAATGHRFVITNEEKIYSSVLLLTFVFSFLYKKEEKFEKKRIKYFYIYF